MRKMNYHNKIGYVNVKIVLLITILMITALLAAQEKVNIIIETNAPDANIYLDNQKPGIIGASGSKSFKAVSAGNHKIRIEKKEFISLNATIEVEELKTIFKFNLAKENKISFQLEPEITKTNPTKNTIKPEIILITLIILILSAIFFILFRLLQASRSLGVIGKFKLIKVIGKGGIATIYKAKDLNRNKTIALKVMDHALVKDADLVYKFFREGEVITKINNEFPEAPVVKVFEYGRDKEKFQGIPYITMELVKGSNLLGILKKEGLTPLKRKLYIVRQIAAALNAAHKLKIYHGDITPDNVLVYEDKVTLIDFGIAFQEYDTYKNMDTSITGKPVYMSPEQCGGTEIDDKTDVYSLGIILFFMCCGAPPFIAQNPTEIIAMHQETPLPEIAESIPEELKDFLKKMLDKKPELRPNALDVVNKMEFLMEQAVTVEESKKENNTFLLAYEKMNKNMNRLTCQLQNLKKITCLAWRRNWK